MKKLLSVILVVAMALSLLCVVPAAAAVGTVDLDETATVAISANPSIRLVKAVATYGDYIYTVQTRYYDNADNAEVGAYLKVYSVSQATGAITDVTPENNNDYSLSYKRSQAVHSLMEVIGDYLYVSELDQSGNGSVKKFSLTNPAAPSLVTKYTGFASRVPIDFEVAGDYLYVGSHYKAFGFDNATTGEVALDLAKCPGIGYNGLDTRAMAYDAHSGVIFANYGTTSIQAYNPTTGATVYTSEKTDVNARQMIVADGVLYVSSEAQNKVYAIDISNGADAIVAAANWNEVADMAGAILVEDGVLYVKTLADTPANTVLKAYKLGDDGTTSTLLDTASCAVGTKGGAFTLVKCGSYLFTATSGTDAGKGELISVGVKVYEDISGITVDLKDNDEVVIARTGTTAYKSAVTNGNYVYALEVGADTTLKIFEKSADNKVTPVSAASEDYTLIGGNGGAMMVDGGYLYVAYHHSGANGVIKKFSLANPAEPFLVAIFTAEWRNVIDMVKVGDTLYASSAWGYLTYADTAETSGTIAPTANTVASNNLPVYLATDSVNGVTYMGINKLYPGDSSRALRVFNNSTGTEISTTSGLGVNQIDDLKVAGDYLYILADGSVYKVALSADGSVAANFANWVKLYDGSVSKADSFDVDGYILYVYCMNTFGSEDAPSVLYAYRMEHDGNLTVLDTAICSSGNAGYCEDAVILDDGFYFVSTHELKRVSIVVPEEVKDHVITHLEGNDVEIITNKGLDNARLIFVTYEASGRMVDYEILPVTLGAGEVDALGASDLDAGVTTKVFLWENMSNCNPLVDFIEW